MYQRIERRLTGCVAFALCALLLCHCDRSGESPPPGADPDDIHAYGEKLYSQKDEELVIRHFFSDRRNGFFVDVGCSHWMKHSTTLYLERHLGWSGIGIDALPDLAESYREHRPGTKFFQYIVTDHSGSLETLYVAGPVSSIDEGWHKRFSFIKAKPKEIQVPTITLNELLDQNGVEKIDFLSVDIEGAEPLALAGFDIERFRPDLVCVEAGRSQTEKRAELEAYFERHGYERMQQYFKYRTGSWYYRPRRLQ